MLCITILFSALLIPTVSLDCEQPTGNRQICWNASIVAVFSSWNLNKTSRATKQQKNKRNSCQAYHHTQGHIQHHITTQTPQATTESNDRPFVEKGSFWCSKPPQNAWIRPMQAKHSETGAEVVKQTNKHHEPQERDQKLGSVAIPTSRQRP